MTTVYHTRDRIDEALDAPVASTYYVASEEALIRGAVAGFNVSGSPRHPVLHPRLSKRDHADLIASGAPRVEGGLEAICASMPVLNQAALRELAGSRHVVERYTADGSKFWSVVPSVRAPAADDIETVADSTFVVDHAADVGQRDKTRTYRLAQCFDDPYVREKFPITPRQDAMVRRMMVSQPTHAARVLQDIMNSMQSSVAVKVVAGEVLRDRPRARHVIRVVAAGVKRTEVSVQCDLVGKVMFIYGPEGEKGWHVSAPLKESEALLDFYWLVRSTGFVDPVVLLEMELVTLGIEVYDGQSCVMPELFHHAGEGGSLPQGVPESVTALMSVEKRMGFNAIASRLLPVEGADGVPMATAVRVSDKHVLINAHVMELEPNCTVGGRSVLMEMQLSRDLWSAIYEGPTDAWMLRQPVDGEMVVVCYLSGGVLSCSAPVKVVSSVGQSIITTTHESVMPGCSGGALVALSDLSLLGIHSAATLTNLLSYRFGAEQFADLVERDDVSSVSRKSDCESFAAAVVNRFAKRGLSAVFRATTESLVPVFAGGIHVGMAVHGAGGKLYTPCDAGMPLKFGIVGMVSKTEEIRHGLYKADAGPLRGTGPAFVREPEYFEKVFIVGFDDDAYVTRETTVAHVGPNGRSFVVADIPGVNKPVVGGLVVAMRDAAVLGQCGPRSIGTPVGLGYSCWPLVRDVQVTTDEPRQVLAAAFPVLNLPAWTDELIEEVFTHSSVGKYDKCLGVFNAGNKPLANIGDNVAKAQLYAEMREAGVPHPQWQSRMQALQRNEVYAELAHRHGYAKCLRVGLGAELPRGSKAYADLTEALIGAASLVERPAVVKQLCRAMGIVGDISEARDALFARG